MIDSKKNTRRMISKYPFKYEYEEPEVYFKPEKASIYIHIPFCVSKCHYCTYISHVNSTEKMREKYVQALCKEIERYPENPSFKKYDIESVYFGGGTPSLLSTEQIKRILDTCKATFNFVDNVDMCMEFDPSTVTDEKLVGFKENGFTRLSIGVQSFDDEVLKVSNRSHDSKTALAAINLIKKHGIKNFNIDLIYPLQCQNMNTWKEDLLKTIELEPAEITAHVLEVWPGTKLERMVKDGIYKLPSFEEEIKMTNEAYDILEAHGFKRWSNCGYYHPDRTNHYSLFMDYYWRTWPMIGFGISAQSVLDQRIYTNVPNINEYLKRIEEHKNPIGLCTKMTKRQEMLRVVIRGLKACYIDKQYFWDRFGVELETIFEKEIEFLLSKKWIINTPERIELTREGQVFDRDVYTVFYTEEDMSKPKDGQVQIGLSLGVEEN